MNVAELVTRYLNHKKFSAQSLRERKRIYGQFCELFGDRSVASIEPYEVILWVDSYTSWSAWTKSTHVSQLRALFGWALKVRIYKGENPCSGLEYRAGDSRRETTKEEFQDILRLSDLNFRQLLIFIRHTGCRLGEAINLTWDQVDLEAGVAIIVNHKTKHKTGKPRILVFTPTVTKLLAKMRRIWELRDPRQKCMFVFTNRYRRPWTKSTADTKWLRLRNKAQIDSGATIHGLRHAFGSEGVRNGGNLKLISLAMGHASTTITEKFYLHNSRDYDAIRREALKCSRKQ